MNWKQYGRPLPGFKLSHNPGIYYERQLQQTFVSLLATKQECCSVQSDVPQRMHVRYVAYEEGTREACYLQRGAWGMLLMNKRDTWGMLLMKSLLRTSNPAYIAYVCCRTYNTKTWLSSAAQAVPFLICIREVTSSNLHRGINYTASWFCSVSIWKLRANTLNYTTTFLILSTLLSSFDAIRYRITDSHQIIFK
jgi:hypothetical protein